jgi:hypothetical protein
MKSGRASGWRWGQLPESEKTYDRATAMETIKAILALGFRITKS